MVAEKVLEVVSTRTKGAVPTLDSSFEELGLDSLDAVEIMYELEEALKVSIPNERAKDMRTVRDVVSGVEALVAAQGGPAAG